MQRPILERIKRLRRQGFEDSIARVYRGEGYLVEPATHSRADGGYDLVLLRETSVLVQSKHWLVDQVGVAPLRELARAMRKVGATGGVCITTGTFTKPARAFAVGTAIELVDGQALVRRFSGSHELPVEKQKAS